MFVTETGLSFKSSYKHSLSRGIWKKESSPKGCLHHWKNIIPLLNGSHWWAHHGKATRQGKTIESRNWKTKRSEERNMNFKSRMSPKMKSNNGMYCTLRKWLISPIRAWNLGNAALWSHELLHVPSLSSCTLAPNFLRHTLTENLACTLHVHIRV